MRAWLLALGLVLAAVPVVLAVEGERRKVVAESYAVDVSLKGASSIEESVGSPFVQQVVAELEGVLVDASYDTAVASVVRCLEAAYGGDAGGAVVTPPGYKARWCPETQQWIIVCCDHGIVEVALEGETVIVDVVRTQELE
ncbi:MAG: hypothetical protein AAF682_27685 [Planctomycetota bacterium]